jgi:hypothetical protein
VVNTDVTQNGPDLTAVESSATYQWINCVGNVTIPGATDQTYTATFDGTYAVIVTLNGCTDTSDCYEVSGLAVGTPQAAILIHPNPTDELVTIRIVGDGLISGIQVTDVSGRTVFAADIQGETKVDIVLDNCGLYLVTVHRMGSGPYRLKVVRQ